MYGGMNRSELHGLLALIVVIALGIGAQGYRSHRRGDGLWVDITPPKTGSPAGKMQGASQIPPYSTAKAAASSNNLTVVHPLENALLATLPAGGSAGSVSPVGDSLPSSPAASPGRLDINLAAQPDLETLPMIGPKKAQAIIAYRSQMGGRFRSLEELRLAANLGDNAWRQVEPLITISSPASPNPVQLAAPISAAVPHPVAASSPPAPAPAAQISLNPAMSAPSTQLAPNPATATPGHRPDTGAVNINTATAQELDAALWNVGPKTAGKIAQWRVAHGPFRRPEDLLQVPGIGPVTLQKNLHKIRVQ